MTTFYSRNVRLAYFEIRRYFALHFIACANICNICVSQSAIPMVNTIMMAVFYRCISVIFSFCSYAQMCWINTWRIVAGVHNYFSKRYFFSGKKFISISMRSYWNFTRQQKNSISVAVCCPSPKPASFRFVYSGFKNIMWAKLCKLMQGSIISRSVVTWSAKFAANGWCSITNNTSNCSSGLIGHFNLLSGTSNIYHINGGG